MKIERIQPLVQVSCTVAGCYGCEWAHNERAGRVRTYVEPRLRVPRFVGSYLYRRLVRRFGAGG